jgi:diadenosine tetraphosphatase ApaH/serine/threonine PP2A family protein phosphatase
MNAREKMRQIFERIDRIAVVGHTHVPGVFTDEPDFYPPDELGNYSYTFAQDEKAIINVGSVGQPRDHDPRASYVILHEDKAEFVRVEYDIQKTVQLIHEAPELADWLGDRLFEGR